MKKSRGKVFIICGIAVLFLTFISCSSEKEGGTIDNDIVISFMTWESQAMNDQILNTFKKFEEQNEGVTIELIPSPLADYPTRLKQMISSNNAPDVFMVGNNWTIQYGASGQLYDWSTLAAEDGIKDIYYPGIVENWEVDGKLYGFPGLLNTYGMFYNKTLFDTAGVAYPENGWTFEDMIAKAKALTTDQDGNHTYGLYTGASARFDPYYVSVYPTSAGEMSFVENIVGNTQVQASDSFKDAITMIANAVKAGYITDYEFNTSNAATMFMEGKMPMLSAGQWYADEFIRNGAKELDWGFVSWPIADPSNPVAIYDCTGWASSKNIENPEIVYDVIKFIHTEMYAEVLPKTPVAPPAAVDFAKPYYDKLIDEGHPEMVAAMKYMLECENKIPVRIQDTFAPYADVFVINAWGPIINGTVDISEVDRLVEDVNDAIDTYLN